MTNVLEMKKAHKILALMDYVPSPTQKGYANHTLHVNLSDKSIKIKPVTQQMRDLFIGGKGFGLWLLWNE